MSSVSRRVAAAAELGVSALSSDAGHLPAGRSPAAFARSKWLARRHSPDPRRPLRLKAAWNAKIWRHTTARLELAQHFYLGYWPEGPPTALPATLQLHPRSVLRCEGWFVVGGGATIVLGPDAQLTCTGQDGGVYVSVNSRIVCMESVTIGEDTAISWDVLIMDTDQHHFTVADEPRPATAPVVIGDRVLIGARATVLKGVTIGDGAVVATGSIVNSDVPARTMVAGSPARVIAEDVEWY